MALVERMAEDLSFNIWVMSRLEGQLGVGSASSARSTHKRLATMMRSCNHYVLSRAAEDPAAVTEAEQRSMFVYTFMSAPVDSSLGFLDDQVREALNSNMNVELFLTELEGMKNLLTPPRQTTLPGWRLACERSLRGDRVHAPQGSSPRFNTSARVSSSRNSATRNKRDSGREQSTLHMTTGNARAHSIPTASMAAPRSSQGDLINLVADRKATGAQLAEFQRRLLHSPEFCQQVENRIGTYTSRAEDTRCDNVIAVLRDVNEIQSTSAPTGTNTQTKNDKRNESPDRASGSSSDKSRPSATNVRWEVQLADQHRKAARQVRKQCQAIERTKKVIPADQAPPKTREGLRNVQSQTKRFASLQIQDYFPDLKTKPQKGCVADAIKAIEELHFEQVRLVQLQMLAAASGEGVSESMQKLIDMVARDMGAVAITARPPARG